jgi:outer membrane protein assembly factor BamB
MTGIPQHVHALPTGGFVATFRGEVERQVVCYDSEHRPTVVEMPWLPPLCSDVRLTGDDTFLAIDRSAGRIVEWRPGRGVVWACCDGEPGRVARSAAGDTLVYDRVSREIVIRGRDGIRRAAIRPRIALGDVTSLDALADDRVLVADGDLHCVYEIDRRGDVMWRYGEPGNPGRRPGQLAEPRCARRTASGTTLIADTMNNRVVEIDACGRTTWSHGAVMRGDHEHTRLLAPGSADRLADGTTVIADSGNLRLVVVDASGDQRWSSAEPAVRDRMLAFPRSVQVLPGGRLLVADTSHNRVLELDADGKVVWAYGAPDGDLLFWPRCAERQADGTTLIADGRHDRVLAVDRDGTVVWCCDGYRDGGRTTPIRDPHQVTRLATGNLLVVESGAHRVVELRLDGELCWRYGTGQAGAAEGQLDDPHFAFRDSAGRTLIADTGNRRLVVVDCAGRLAWRCMQFWWQGRKRRFGRLRWCELRGEHDLWFLDTSNACIGRLDWYGCARAVLEPVSPAGYRALRGARWLAHDGAELVVSDTEGHQLIRLRAPICRSAPALGNAEESWEL